MWSARLPAIAQITGVLVVLAVLAFSPPAAGKMILIPLTGAAAAQIVPRALSGGAALIGAGPLHGSLVVSGDRRRLAAAFASSAILIFAAPPVGCGAGTGTPG